MADILNFSPTTRSGYVCIALPGKRLEELNIPMMVLENQDPRRTAYAITVDYKHGTFLIPFTFPHHSFPIYYLCFTSFSSFHSTTPAKLRDNYRHFGA